VVRLRCARDPSLRLKNGYAQDEAALNGGYEWNGLAQDAAFMLINRQV
jgi:hypothetical protein